MPEIRLPDRAEAVARAAEFVEAEAARAGWPVADVTRAVLAVSEAVGNAVEHGPVGGRIHVRFASAPEALTLEVTDGGDGPNPSLLDAAALPADKLAEGGRGLYIMKTVANEVRVAEGAVVLRFVRSGRA
ncbi:ATP-binding protein [Rubrivirga sp. S365]|uniref:ATP-binding protein n=1 Tax=Rubrivirga sp. S365 TaxID=3076080 RepID=UPI0028C883B7|nr:ATP-binding protein [Rubrivirga sp. S365]MDT7857150.1 ATP-binding protein [Rubrivirga sp. S365]